MSMAATGSRIRLGLREVESPPSQPGQQPGQQTKAAALLWNCFFGSCQQCLLGYPSTPLNAIPSLSCPTVVSVNLEGTVLALSPRGGHWLHLLVSPADERASFCWTALVLRMVFLRLSQKYTFFIKMR